ncbi:MAG TPA: molybdopterin molybdotransferase MoeA [Methylotenera sp.]|nr:molybdopterin molybdotransferase MoeA [Methylotenera sp.]HPH05941.1 molybdopterin molybdotransferase MoeA [Methylotenera sp.]HPN02179.1 molybdopterin molybdotransferase MoeA [Methylotenera sp.]
MKHTLSQLSTNPCGVDDYDPNAMSVEQARHYIQQFLSPVSAHEELPIRETLGRVLSADVISPSNVPNYNNSAMDGFAFKFSEDLKTFKVIGTAFAGKPFRGAVNAGECVKIMTGAMLPLGADTVVMQEHVTVNSEHITLLNDVKQAANVRFAGEDLKLGQTVLSKGHLMRPADLGLIASLGIAKVSVYKKLKVAFFSTGDELVSVDKPLNEGQIYDSNRYTLFGMLTRLGVEVADLGAIPDNVQQLEDTLIMAASNHHVVITSGGVSVGEADHMKALLAKHGEVLFWKINMKPGRPLAYGKIANAHYFGLPGNPVSAMVTFYQFVREALMSLMGATAKPLPTFSVECTQAIKKATGRTEFQRGILFEEHSVWKVKPTGLQGSAMLSSMSQANCFIVLGESVGNLEAGALVKVQLLDGLI